MRIVNVIALPADVRICPCPMVSCLVRRILLALRLVFVFCHNVSFFQLSDTGRRLHLPAAGIISCPTSEDRPAPCKGKDFGSYPKGIELLDTHLAIRVRE